MFAPAAAGAVPAGLLGVRLGGDLQATRLVLDLSERIAPEVDLSTDRLVVQVKAVPTEAVGERGAGKGLISTWSGKVGASGERVEAALAVPARIAHRFFIPPGQGVSYWRYVVDLEPGAPPVATAPPLVDQRRSSDLALSRLAAVDPTLDSIGALTADPPRGIVGDVQSKSKLSPDLPNGPPEPQTEPLRVRLASTHDVFHPSSIRKVGVKPAAIAARRKVVVIDAGHGGHDSGALGANHQEKELTLAAALALRERLERTGRYKVVLTRDSDVFIPLADRVKIARKGGVDLFLSLHADSAGADAAPHGASVYTLSDTGVGRAHYVIGHDEWFTKVAARSGQPGVSQILLDLSQRSTRNHSAVFADLLLDKLQGEGVDILPRGHRDAGYFVLLAPDVPAALLEMGFVTNPEDESRLAESKSRARMISAVAEAIDAYFDQSGRSAPAPKVVSRVTPEPAA